MRDKKRKFQKRKKGKKEKKRFVVVIIPTEKYKVAWLLKFTLQIRLNYTRKFCSMKLLSFTINKNCFLIIKLYF